MRRVRSDSSAHTGMSSFGFIIGTGRCGTTMIAQFLNANSLICVPPELQILFEHSGNGSRLYEMFSSGHCKEYTAQDFIREIKRMCPHNLLDYFDYKSFFTRLSYPVTDLRQLLIDLYGAIAASRNKNILFEQVPWYGQKLDIVHALFPGAKYIHMIRDGRDVAVSFSRTPWWSASLMDNLERWHFEITKTADDARSLLGSDQYLEVKYEDFVINTRKILRLIIDFIGVPFERAMLSPENHIDYSKYRMSDHKTISSAAYNNWSKRKEKGVFADNVFGWKATSPEAFKDIPQHIRLTLSRFGYEG